MEEDIKILEELSRATKIDELGYSYFILKSEYRLALENLLTRYKQLEEYLGEIDSKEVSDALHMLLHCSLKDTQYETQKEQFEIVNCYIKQLEEENIGLKIFKEMTIYRLDVIEPRELISKSKVKEIIESHYPDVACQKLTELLREE